MEGANRLQRNCFSDNECCASSGRGGSASFEKWKMDTLESTAGHLVPSYVQDKLQGEQQEIFQLDEDLRNLDESKRTVGCCAHVASVLWFPGYARHNQGVKYPNTSFLSHVLDAANRMNHI
ncbi:hypothetical protein JTB14_004867 [Gonioctena quinquepunctata]|nr:hypothetical protein JTB14_004867 [Gonioctena quinquepunctata]